MNKDVEHKILDLYNFRYVQKICNVALTDSKFFLLCGRTGIGKTTALEFFIDNDKSFGVKYIKIVENMSQKDFIQSLGNAFNYDREQISSLAIINWINLMLEGSNENQLLIIDEGGKLNTKQYGFIHGLRDATKNKLGIIIASPEYLIDELQKWNRKRKKGVPEFFGRINGIFKLKTLTHQEIIAVCQSRGVSDVKIIQNKFIDLKDLRALRNALDKYLHYDKVFKDI